MPRLCEAWRECMPKVAIGRLLRHDDQNGYRPSRAKPYRMLYVAMVIAVLPTYGAHVWARGASRGSTAATMDCKASSGVFWSVADLLHFVLDQLGDLERIAARKHVPGSQSLGIDERGQQSRGRLLPRLVGRQISTRLRKDGLASSTRSEPNKSPRLLRVRRSVREQHCDRSGGGHDGVWVRKRQPPRTHAEPSGTGALEVWKYAAHRDKHADPSRGERATRLPPAHVRSRLSGLAEPFQDIQGLHTPP